MGNRHSQRNRDQNYRHVRQHENSIDLDEIVEQWSWMMWERTKTKSLSKLKREDLLIKINWNRFVFTQHDVQFFDSSSQHLPRSQILFRTNFTNKTSNEQYFQLKTDRTTRSTYSFCFTNNLTISNKATVIFRLPNEILQLGGGIQHEQIVELGQNSINEKTLHWTVDSPVNVAPWTRAVAQLIIDEEEYRSDFLIPIEFFGRISVTFVKRQTPEVSLKFLDGDIVEIVREMNFQSLKDVKILDESRIRWILRGHCEFRYGIAHHVVLNHEKINRVVSIPVLHIDSNVSRNFRSIRTTFVSPTPPRTSPMHLSIHENDHL